MFGKKSGGNAQRERFGAKASPEPTGGARPEPKTSGGLGEMHEGSGTTTIDHETNRVHHADGETSEHPSLGHALTHIHGKHEGGEAMHVHNHGGNEHSEGKPITTHHHGHDGMVEGPHHHGSMDEAAEHMKNSIGEGTDGENGAQLGQAGTSGGMDPMNTY